MTISTSLFAFEDCIKILDLALESKNGIRAQVTDENAAIYFRSRIHQARKLTRDENCKVYSEGDPMYARSAYDGLVVRIKQSGDEFWVCVEKHATKILAVEEIEEQGIITFDPPKQLTREPQKLLPPPLLRRKL